jgi:hypothetical protein
MTSRSLSWLRDVARRQGLRCTQTRGVVEWLNANPNPRGVLAGLASSPESRSRCGAFIHWHSTSA